MADSIDFVAMVAKRASVAVGVMPSSPNGITGVVDLANPVDYIAPDEMFVRTAHETIDLRASLARRIWISAGRPPNGAAYPYSHTQMVAAADYIGRLITKHEVCRIARAAGLTVEFRNTDTVSATDWANLDGSNDMVRAAAAHADIMWDILADGMMARVTSNSRLTLIMLVANAIHRAKCEGHNWYTANTNQPRTVAGRAARAAGASHDVFGPYAQRHGHDDWHFLTHTALDSIASAMVGEIQARVPIGTMYGTVDVGGKMFHQVFVLPESATDRYPISTIGISAIMLGLDAISDLMVGISAKIPGTLASTGLSEASSLKATLSSTRISRESLTNIRNHLARVISLAVGYGCRNIKGREDYEMKPSVYKFANRDPAAMSQGKAIGSYLDEKKSNEEAMSAQLAGAISQICASLASAAAAVVSRSGAIVAAVVGGGAPPGPGGGGGGGGAGGAGGPRALAANPRGGSGTRSSATASGGVSSGGGAGTGSGGASPNAGGTSTGGTHAASTIVASVSANTVTRTTAATASASKSTPVPAQGPTRAASTSAATTPATPATVAQTTSVSVKTPENLGGTASANVPDIHAAAGAGDSADPGAASTTDFGIDDPEDNDSAAADKAKSTLPGVVIKGGNLTKEGKKKKDKKSAGKPGSGK